MGRKDAILRDLEAVRERTLSLLELVSDDYLRRRIHSFYSPIGWHFGHVGRTEEFWVVNQALGREVLDDRLTFLFHDCPENPKDNRVNIPPRADIVAYLARTRQRVLEALQSSDLDTDDPFLQDGYAWEFAIQHEYQHQETIMEMLQLIQQDSLVHSPPLREGLGAGDRMCPKAWSTLPTHGSHASREGVEGAPDSPPLKEGLGVGDRMPPKDRSTPLTQSPLPGEHSPSFHPIPAGTFTMGSNWLHGYDNEKEQHEVHVAAFELGTAPVSAGDWLAFMHDGGYQRRELWTEQGWEWRCEEDATMPEYWHQGDDAYFYISHEGLRSINAKEAVNAISWYEADAYSQWSGCRLPTEEEWEYAAATTGLLNERQVWEWTSSKFLPYPGFSAFPYDGYSKDHMKGEHYVCRGGSWTTAEPIRRRTFRNWYVPTYRQGFLGLRLAR